MSHGEPAAETMPFTRVRTEYWPIFAAKKSQTDNTLLARIRFTLKDISTYNCCQAKPIYLFLVFPHIRLVFLLKITITVIIFITFVKIMHHILCKTRKDAFMVSLFLLWKHPPWKYWCYALNFSNAQHNMLSNPSQEDKRAKNFTLKVCNFVFQVFPNK